MRQKTVECGLCKGTGQLPLSDSYRETLDALGSGEIHAAELGRRMGVNGTAMSNRLEYLVAHGFAQSRKDGRKTLFSVKKP